ncbi:two-component regulator propeller domain-containing protein [Bacteroidota bacterium]
MIKQQIISCFFYTLLFFIYPFLIYAGEKDESFIQEFHQAYRIGTSGDENDVRTIVVDHSGKVWAGTKTGLFILDQVTQQWEAILDSEDQGPINDLFVDAEGTVWIAAWNGLYLAIEKQVMKINITTSPVGVVNEIAGNILIMGSEGIWELVGNKWIRDNMPYSRAVRELIPDKNGGYYLGTGKGLYHKTTIKTILYQKEEELLSDNIFGLAYSDNDELWIGGLGGVTIYQDDKRIRNFTPKEGLPNTWVRCIHKAPDGTMWVGTDLGVTRYDGNSWSLRHSRRWLLSDRVRDIAFDQNGTAWIATSGGVSAIKKKKITFAQKADYYYNILLQRHIREPYLVEKCRFSAPGDTTTWEPNDDDNDGQYTSMYLVMESYRYAVTKEPEARENATKAFKALKFLQTVTETEGFVARTVIPATWTRMADPNVTISDRDWADMIMQEPRDTRIEDRWILSSDGKWLWKRGTSSDEITGHMYGYLFYYDLVADNKQKKEIKEHVLRIIDYIIDKDYVLVDIDGAHTEWGVWAPEFLNHNPDWASERGVNSVEILSFLKLAYHVSGNKKYQKEYYELLNEHLYKDNIVHAKTTLPSWRTYIDDELLALAYPALILYEDDSDLQTLYLKSLDNWYDALKDDDNPYFYFLYNVLASNELNREKSIKLLQDNPLDLIRWRVDNSKREDLFLTHSPILEDIQTSRLVPPSERGIMRWDNNPWKAIQGDGGYTESDGVHWLLAYWMARYYGLIE